MPFSNQRLIFVMSTGRCGTLYLSKVMESVPGVASFHEPEPDFAAVMRAAQHYYPLFYQFLIERKLPHIYSIPERVYIETSHLFIKGFALPMLSLGVVPDIIVLRRPPREVALSMLRMGAIPGRNYMGQRYLLQPDDDVLAPLSNGDHWHMMTDYQLCYWYTMEIERRIKAYTPRFLAAGSRFYNTTLSEIAQEDGFIRLVDRMCLPRPNREMYDERRVHRYNSRDDDRMPDNDEDLDESERDVISRIGRRDDIPWVDGVYGGWWSE